MAKPFGNPTYVASDVAYRTQSEADTAAEALVEEIGSSFAEIDAVARGNPKLRANVAHQASRTPASRSTASTRSPRRATATTRRPGTRRRSR